MVFHKVCREDRGFALEIKGEVEGAASFRVLNHQVTSWQSQIHTPQGQSLTKSELFRVFAQGIAK
jgi:hypothetical protein